jgi:HAD superfamily hydrolase (TIGR01509 family)
MWFMGRPWPVSGFSSAIIAGSSRRRACLGHAFGVAPPSPTRLVIFDCDGVLVDSERLAHEVLVAMLAEQGLQLSLEAALRRFIGLGDEATVDAIAELLGRPPPAGFLEDMLERTHAAFPGRLRPIPGIAAALDWLPVPACVASNGSPQKMQISLGLTGLLPRLQGHVYSAWQVPRPKPFPDLHRFAAAREGMPPGQCVVIEDSPAGVEAARAAGMRVFGYSDLVAPERLLAAGAERCFASMAELPALPFAFAGRALESKAGGAI